MGPLDKFSGRTTDSGFELSGTDHDHPVLTEPSSELTPLSLAGLTTDLKSDQRILSTPQTYHGYLRPKEIEALAEHRLYEQLKRIVTSGKVPDKFQYMLTQGEQKKLERIAQKLSNLSPRNTDIARRIREETNQLSLQKRAGLFEITAGAVFGGISSTR